MTRATLVFLGPTLPAAEAAALLPGADVRPPVAVGEILAIARAPRRRRPARIAIVDGYFERMAAVWHKELLLAIEAGIEVWGAASMGALRAAELDRFGMRGVGTIYRAFARGTLIADDEVAVAHLPGEHGYRAVSDALVNLRDGLAAAVRARAISRATCDALIELARARFYRERTWATLVADGRAARLPRAELDRLVTHVAARRPDRKAADARMLLRELARTRPRVGGSRMRVPRTWALGQLARLLR